MPTRPANVVLASETPSQKPTEAERPSTGPVPTPAPTDSRVDVPSDAARDEVNQTLLHMQNAQRAKHDKPALVLNPKLIEAAKEQAIFCATHHDLTHTGTDDSSVGDRVTAQGYRWASVAENAEMQMPRPAGSGGPDPRTAERAVEGWMDSPPHRANLLGAYQECGACYADAQDGTRYWIVTFGKPQKSPRADDPVSDRP